MGDLSAEPSMEDILASIKRVIKEGEAQTPVRRQQPRPLGGHERDHVLELNEPLGTAQPEPAPTGQSPSPLMTAPWEEDAGFNEVSPLASAPVPTPTPTPTPAPAVAPASTPAPASASPSEPPAAVSPATVEATRGALGALSRLVVKPEPDGDGTLEGLVRDMLRPMLSDWLDQNLPRLVEQMVAREIAKITSQQN